MVFTLCFLILHGLTLDVYVYKWLWCSGHAIILMHGDINIADSSKCWETQSPIFSTFMCPYKNITPMQGDSMVPVCIYLAQVQSLICLCFGFNYSFYSNPYLLYIMFNNQPIVLFHSSHFFSYYASLTTNYASHTRLCIYMSIWCLWRRQKMFGRPSSLKLCF